MSASSARSTEPGRTSGSVLDDDLLDDRVDEDRVDEDRVDDTPVHGAPAYVATGLPSGVSISADGVISGAVTSLGTHTVTITTSDPARDPRSVTFDWIVL
jgi:hypothetical protein